MLNTFKKKSLQKKVNKNLEDRDVSGLNTKVTSVAFLIDAKLLSDFNTLVACASNLGIESKHVKIYSFKNTKKKLPVLEENQVTNKEFNWQGKLKDKNTEEFLQTSYDLLVAIYEGNHLYLNILTSESKANFKVGFKQTDQRLFDLVLGTNPSDISSLSNELKKYLTLLNKL